MRTINNKHNYPKVILIGGTPFSGKTTIARKIASVLEYSCISTDDIGAAIKAIIPEYSPMTEIDYREYYIKHNVSELIEHTEKLHQKLWPAIENVIKAHSLWSNPIVVEGWALRPEKVLNLEYNNVKSIWFLADEKLLEERVKKDKDFYLGASDEGKMITHYLQRSFHTNKEIENFSKVNKIDVIKISKCESSDFILKKCLKKLELRR